MINNEHKFYNLVCEKGFYTKPKRLKFFLKKQLFNNIDFRQKRIIDIGGGNGLYGFYALMMGASEVVIIEPEFDGSSNGMIKQFHDLHNLFGKTKQISLFDDIIQNYKTNKKFDVVLIANSINHFDENACIELHKSRSSIDIYNKIFDKINQLTESKSKIILTDCTNKNFYSSIGKKNPFMPTIEWYKHQPPEIWASLLSNYGYTTNSIQWTSPNFLGRIGKSIFGNKLFSYFLLSHFRLEMERC